MIYFITGTWVNKGIGTVQMETNGLVWNYVAPTLGNWIAAPPPSSGRNQSYFKSHSSAHHTIYQSKSISVALTLKSISSYGHVQPSNQILCMCKSRLYGACKLNGFHFLPHIPSCGYLGRNSCDSHWIFISNCISLQVRAYQAI